MSVVKEIRGDKVDENPGVKHVKLRGVEYTISELDVDQYDAAMKVAEDRDGNVPFGKLLRAMVGMAVRPLPKGGPFKFPVYRTLEGVVNDMHFQDVPDELATPEPGDETGSEAAEGEAAPNA